MRVIRNMVKGLNFILFVFTVVTHRNKWKHDTSRWPDRPVSQDHEGPYQSNLASLNSCHVG